MTATNIGTHGLMGTAKPAYSATPLTSAAVAIHCVLGIGFSVNFNPLALSRNSDAEAWRGTAERRVLSPIANGATRGEEDDTMVTPPNSTGGCTKTQNNL